MLCVLQPLAPSVRAEETEETPQVVFQDMSTLAGVVSKPTWKYGGPCVFDMDNDGRYDFVLGNHDQTPIQLFVANPDNTFTERIALAWREDFHGITAGDYDLDGDNDLLVSIGGGNGTAPKPPRLLRNDGGEYKDVTEEVGISRLGARGRSVRWIDLDLDGDLDMLQINAKKMISEEVPRNLLFENLGNGTFEYRSSPSFEDIEAEKVHVTDFNQDQVPDIITFSNWDPVTFWMGRGNFSFINASELLSPGPLSSLQNVKAIAEADIDNDGDLDYYLCRGGNPNDNRISHDKRRARLDLRTKGERGRKGISFTTHPWRTGIDLLAFDHFPRGKRVSIPLFLGEEKTQHPAPRQVLWVGKEQAKGFPEELPESGWYLGYLGQDRWRFEWDLRDDLAWTMIASIIGIEDFDSDIESNEANIPDILLLNEGRYFKDISYRLPEEARSNNTGVVPGDFDNDGSTDFFLIRYGELKERILDVIVLNHGKGNFESLLSHGATDLSEDAHGDMGSAFDYDLDGSIDLLVGDDDFGTWHLYRNETWDDKAQQDNGNYLLLHVRYSPKGVDPMGAEVRLKSGETGQYKLVGAGSSAFSQSQLNILHFGLGENEGVDKVEVRWRDGTTERLVDVQSNQLVKIGSSSGRGN